MDGMPSLVTGGAGFVGSRLVRRLLEQGDQVHLFVRAATSLDRIADIANRLTIHRVDLADRASLRCTLAQIAPCRVYHLAAETRIRAASTFVGNRSGYDTYVAPVLNLVKALRGLACPPEVMVRAGTIAEYGPIQPPFSEVDWTASPSPYGVGMQETTRALADMAVSLPFPVITARLALCYGPGQDRSFLVPALIDGCLAGRPVVLNRPGDRRDLLHVDDAVDALLTIAGQGPFDCAVVNIGSGTSHAVRDVAAKIIAMTGCAASLVTTHSQLPGDCPLELLLDVECARLRFGWKARISLDDGLRETVAAEQNLLKFAG